MTATEAKTTEIKEPTVSIFIPRMTDDLTNAQIDNTEHVTINGKTTLVQRGVHVNVPIQVFEILKAKYPDL